MAFSRKFKALGKITGFFAAAFGAIGVLAGALNVLAGQGGAVLSSMYTFGVMYGAVGGITGAVTALLVARTESGRRIDELPTWRIAAWGLVGGIAPAALFAPRALIFGASASQLLPLIGVGLFGGVLGGVVSASASATAKRTALSEGETPPKLPAT